MMRSRGFTFFELMLGLALAAVVAVLALPSLARSEQIYRLSAAASHVQTQLHSARIQAINRNANHRVVVVNPTTYALQRWNTGSSAWDTVQTFQTPRGLTISTTGAPEFRARGNAGASAVYTVTNLQSETRQIIVETSGYVHVQ